MAVTTHDPNDLDLESYLARIDYGGPLEPSLDALKSLHLAHATHIPFENLDILLNRPIRLDLESLQAKLVQGGRGGYCFEQNLLFAAVLRRLGFFVRQLAARVRYRTREVLPRTHMLLLVDLEDSTWLADVGFGAEGLLLPVPFGAGREAKQFAWTYRVTRDGDQWVLQSLRGDSWMDLYGFTLEAQQVVDYEVANHYTSTYPASRFVQTLTVQLPSPEGRTTLRNRELIVDRGDSGPESRSIASDEELLTVLAETFNLRFPPRTRFSCLE